MALKKLFGRLIPIAPHALSAQIVLEDMLEEAAQMDHIVIVCGWKNGKTGVVYSRMKKKDLAYCALALQKVALKVTGEET